MSFDNNWPKRKDHRKPYYKSEVWDRTCRNHGSCGWCSTSRAHKNKRREPIVLEHRNEDEFEFDLEDFQLYRYSDYLLGIDSATEGDWFY